MDNQYYKESRSGPWGLYRITSQNGAEEGVQDSHEKRREKNIELCNLSPTALIGH